MRFRLWPRLSTVLLIAGCARGGSHALAWPKAQVEATAAGDGGESLAPRQPSNVTAIEASEDDTPAPTAVVAPTVTPTVSAPTSIAPIVAPSATEEPVMTDDITIEVDD